MLYCTGSHLKENSEYSLKSLVPFKNKRNPGPTVETLCWKEFRENLNADWKNSHTTLCSIHFQRGYMHYKRFRTNKFSHTNAPMIHSHTDTRDSPVSVATDRRGGEAVTPFSDSANEIGGVDLNRGRFSSMVRPLHLRSLLKGGWWGVRGAFYRLRKTSSKLNTRTCQQVFWGTLNINPLWLQMMSWPAIFKNRHRWNDLIQWCAE